jgi:hypothetical protein
MLLYGGHGRARQRAESSEGAVQQEGRSSIHAKDAQSGASLANPGSQKATEVAGRGTFELGVVHRGVRRPREGFLGPDFSPQRDTCGELPERRG